MSINNWRVYCVDENDWINTQSVNEPTTCPNNAGHTIRSVQIIDNIDNFVFLGEETEINETIQGGFGIKYKKSGADKYAGIVFDVNTEKFNFYKGNDTMPVVGVTGDIDNGIIDIDTFNSINHTELSNIGTNTHAQIDTHIEDGMIHFTKGSISHTELQDIGTTYTHSDIDAHIDDSTIHFTESSISHLNIQDIGTNSHSQIDSHIGDTSLHFTKSSILHSDIQGVGTNTHVQIDSHIADTTIHFTKGNISHTDIQDIGSNSHTQIDAHIGNSSIHYPVASIDHSSIQNSGSYTHTQIDSHIDDTNNPHNVTLTQLKPTTTRGDLMVESGSGLVRFPTVEDNYILVSNSNTPTGLQWKEITDTGNYSYISIWAEENSSLNGNSYQWAYGNGANTPQTGGIVIPVDCDLFALSWVVKNIGAEITCEINGTAVASTEEVSALSGYRSFTPIEINPGDRVNFQTTEGSSNGPNTICAWFRKQVTGFGGGNGEINTVSNLGAGVGLFKQKNEQDLEFKSINNGDGIAIIDDTGNNEVDVALDINSLTQDVTPNGATDYLLTFDQSAGTHKKVLINDLPQNLVGETNTASNVGTGVGVFKQKSTYDLELRSINSNNLSVALSSDDINVDLDINGLSAHNGNNLDNNNDYLVLYDASSSSHKKLKLGDLDTAELTATNVNSEGIGFFKQKSGTEFQFRGLNTITHSGLYLNLDSGNNEIDVGLDINSLTNDSTPDGSADYVVVYDSSAGLHKKVIINNLPSSNTGISVAKIYDKKTKCYNGGDFNEDQWITRDLNTLEQTGTFVTALTNDCFTLAAGTYIVNIKAPAYDVNEHKIRLYNHTSESVEIYGQNASADNSNNDTCMAFLDGFFTIGSSAVFSVEHICETYENGDGFGRATGFGDDEIYTTVLLTKIG